MTFQTADIDCLNSGDILQDCVGDFCIVSLGFNQSSRVNRLVYLCHRRVAEALRDKMNWQGRLIAGSTRTGYVFVFADDN